MSGSIGAAACAQRYGQATPTSQQPESRRCHFDPAQTPRLGDDDFISQSCAKDAFGTLPDASALTNSIAALGLRHRCNRRPRPALERGVAYYREPRITEVALHAAATHRSFVMASHDLATWCRVDSDTRGACSRATSCDPLQPVLPTSICSGARYA